MEMLCEVRAVTPNYDQNSKLKAKVQLEVLFPYDGIEIPIYEASVKSGALKRFEFLIGQKAVVPVEIDEYKGKIQYQLSFGGMPCSLQEVADSLAMPAAKVSELKGQQAAK